MHPARVHPAVGNVCPQPQPQRLMAMAASQHRGHNHIASHPSLSSTATAAGGGALALPVQASLAKFDQLRLLVERAVARHQLAELDAHVRAILDSITVTDVSRLIGRDTRAIRHDAFIDIFESDAVSISAYLLQVQPQHLGRAAGRVGERKGSKDDEEAGGAAPLGVWGRGMRFGLPLHNHRGMFVWSTVLSGAMAVSSFDFVRGRDRKRDHRPLPAADLAAKYLAPPPPPASATATDGGPRQKQKPLTGLRAPPLCVTSLPPEAVPAWPVDVNRVFAVGETRRMVTPKGGGEIHTIAAAPLPPAGDANSGSPPPPPPPPLIFIDVSVPPYDRPPLRAPCTYFVEVTTAPTPHSHTSASSSGSGSSDKTTRRAPRRSRRLRRRGGARPVVVGAADDVGAARVDDGNRSERAPRDATSTHNNTGGDGGGQQMPPMAAHEPDHDHHHRRRDDEDDDDDDGAADDAAQQGAPRGVTGGTGGGVGGTARRPRWLVAVEEPHDLVLASCPLLPAVAQHLRRPM